MNSFSTNRRNIILYTIFGMKSLERMFTRRNSNRILHMQTFGMFTRHSAVLYLYMMTARKTVFTALTVEFYRQNRRQANLRTRLIVLRERRFRLRIQMRRIVMNVFIRRQYRRITRTNLTIRS